MRLVQAVLRVVALLGVCIMPDLAAAGGPCIYRVIVRPTGTVTAEDPLTLEIQIRTPDGPAHLKQPTAVAVIANEIFVDIFADGGDFDSPDSLVETVELGTLPAGDYEYQVVQHPIGELSCGAQTVSGSFCVEDPNCTDASCRCPVFTPSYTIIDLGTLGGYSSVALGINDLGQVAGGADTRSGFRHAFLWDKGEMADLGVLPPLPHSEAWDLNNVGQVVGYGGAGSAILWDQGQIIDLGPLIGAPTGNSAAYGINDAGQVVGRSLLHAFLLEDGVVTDLTSAFPGSAGIAWDINKSGQVVGGASLWNSQDGTLTNLGTLGGPATGALGINDLGQVVGASQRDAGQVVNFHAFLWENGEMIDLGAILGLPSSSAKAINNLGQIIGPSYLYDNDHGMRRLRDLIEIDSGWSDLSARDINNLGQIVGDGFTTGGLHAFLMTPVGLVFGFGRCCYDAAFIPQCVDHVTQDRCDLLAAPRFFVPDGKCSGEPGECPTDCNDNGVPDSEDLASGTSQDCDQNGRPDECEFVTDVDGDGIADGCDPCPTDPNDDSDGDGVCDSEDVCPGADDAVDTNDDGVPDCLEAIPTMSEWGLVMTGLILLVCGKIYFGLHRRKSASKSSGSRDGRM